MSRHRRPSHSFRTAAPHSPHDFRYRFRHRKPAQGSPGRARRRPRGDLPARRPSDVVDTRRDGRRQTVPERPLPLRRECGHSWRHSGVLSAILGAGSAAQSRLCARDTVGPRVGRPGQGRQRLRPPSPRRFGRDPAIVAACVRAGDGRHVVRPMARRQPLRGQHRHRSILLHRGAAHVPACRGRRGHDGAWSWRRALPRQGPGPARLPPKCTRLAHRWRSRSHLLRGAGRSGGPRARAFDGYRGYGISGHRRLESRTRRRVAG